MKVLCPTDFSPASKNAIQWIAEYLDSMNSGILELVHCAEYPTILDKQGNIGALLKERAQEDISELEYNLQHEFPDLTINTSVYKANPKEFIVKIAKKIEADLVVVGTSGFTAVKDLTIGSLTEYISNHSTIPVLAIPPNISYKGLYTIVVGVGKKELKHPEAILQLVNLVCLKDPDIYLTQVLDKGEHLMQFDYRIEDYLKHLDYEHHGIECNEIVAEALTKFIQEVNAEILCMIHHQHNWLGRLFNHSYTKDILFDLKIPFLIIPDVAVEVASKESVLQR